MDHSCIISRSDLSEVVRERRIYADNTGEPNDIDRVAARLFMGLIDAESKILEDMI